MLLRVMHTKPSCAALILQGDFSTGSVLASTLTKLVLRFSEVSKDVKALNTLRAEVTFRTIVLFEAL